MIIAWLENQNTGQKKIPNLGKENPWRKGKGPEKLLSNHGQCQHLH